jgi:hypothetical protein
MGKLYEGRDKKLWSKYRWIFGRCQYKRSSWWWFKFQRSSRSIYFNVPRSPLQTCLFQVRIYCIQISIFISTAE